MIATLIYRCPVYVEVDVDEGRVVRVLIADTESEFDDESNTVEAVSDRGISQAEFALAKATRDRAVEIADEAEWPAWEFGS